MCPHKFSLGASKTLETQLGSFHHRERKVVGVDVDVTFVIFGGNGDPEEKVFHWLVISSTADDSCCGA